LHFGTGQFLDKDDRSIYNARLLIFFMQIIEKNTNIPSLIRHRARNKINEFPALDKEILENIQTTENGFYSKIKNFEYYFNNLFSFNRDEEEGAALISTWEDGKREEYFKDGIRHAINRPAILYEDLNQKIENWYYNGLPHNFNGPACYELTKKPNSRLPKTDIEYWWFGSKTPSDHYVLLRNDYKKKGYDASKYIKDDVIINESKIKIRLLR
jgi:hypothetical protein